jgi:alpha-mannosidase
VFSSGKNILTEIAQAWRLSNHPPGLPVVFNSLPWKRKEIIRMNTTEATGCKATEFPEYGLVSAAGFKWADVIFLPRSPKGDSATVTIQNTGQGVFILENSQLRVQVQNGVITSLIHRLSGREVVAKGGKANQFVIFDDKPLFRQAWDVEVYHLNSRMELPSGESIISENTPYRVAVVTETKISDQSYLKSTISLSPAIEGQQSYVEFNVDVEWHEAMKFLKVEFPVSVTSKEASYETQFGFVTRPTHYNTTWDMAKFEVCCHKWADISEYNFGVSVFNDSKYGFATCGNLMRLSLLRAPKAPDGSADMGNLFRSPTQVTSPTDKVATQDITRLNTPYSLMKVTCRRPLSRRRSISTIHWMFSMQLMRLSESYQRKHQFNLLVRLP